MDTAQVETQNVEILNSLKWSIAVAQEILKEPNNIHHAECMLKSANLLVDKLIKHDSDWQRRS